MAQIPDPYRALGLPRGASAAQIKAAHRTLAKRFHPDGAEGDARRFLKVQAAYRVLTDPLLRREWDARHAPGPMSARSPRPAPAPARRRAAATDEPPARQPRSSRAYTWSAGEVPWWEDGGRSDRKPASEDAAAESPRPDPSLRREQPPVEPPVAQPDMDVYNRSSGAAWSMAARAYFRRGDKELPNRGSFHHQGTQPLTAARARAAAEAQARHQSAAAAQAEQPRPSSSFAYAAAGVEHDPFARRGPYWRTDRAWPTLGQRLLLALVGWLPAAALLAYAGSVVAGQEVGTGVVIAVSLIFLFALPRLAYFAAAGTFGAVVGGALALIVLAVDGVRLPLSAPTITLVGFVALAAYLATMGILLLFGGRSRPWTR